MTNSSKGRLEDRRIARHRKFGERLTRRSGKRVQCVGLAVVADHVIEECTELRPAQLDSRVGNLLHQALQVEFGADRNACAVEHFQGARFLAQLGNPGFQGFVHRQEPRLKLLAFVDVVIGAAQQWRAVFVRRRDLPLAGEPVQSPVRAFNAEFHIKAAGGSRGFQGAANL